MVVLVLFLIVLFTCGFVAAVVCDLVAVVVVPTLVGNGFSGMICYHKHSNMAFCLSTATCKIESSANLTGC